MKNENFMLKISKILKNENKMPFWKNRKCWIHNEELQLIVIYALFIAIFSIIFIAI
tara:strand:+ start:909 stop:1076 length:168 start_codon:yes stop_codon:yes gene_type:complete